MEITEVRLHNTTMTTYYNWMRKAMVEKMGFKSMLDLL